jgi:RNA polymerase sigma-70 factor (ECF subfamily)
MSSLAADSSDTQRLLEQVRAGEPEATDRLLDRHRPYLRRLVEVRLDPRLRARVDPSDVVQEAQMEAVRRLDGYLRQPPMPFRLWLRQIAYDRLLMLRRHHVAAARRAVGRDVPLPDRSSLQLARQLLASGPTPSQQLVQREFVRRVRQAVSQLPDGDREVLVLRNLEGLSNREAAQVLGMDPATASRRYGRAVIRLRAILLQSGLGGSAP